MCCIKLTGKCSRRQPRIHNVFHEILNSPSSFFPAMHFNLWITYPFLQDLITDRAITALRHHADHHKDEPFFMILTHTVPHHPLQASTLLCKAKRQYLLACKASRYCLWRCTAVQVPTFICPRWLLMPGSVFSLVARMPAMLWMVGHLPVWIYLWFARSMKLILNGLEYAKVAPWLILPYQSHWPSIVFLNLLYRWSSRFWKWKWNESDFRPPCAHIG